MEDVAFNLSDDMKQPNSFILLIWIIILIVCFLDVDKSNFESNELKYRIISKTNVIFDKWIY